MEWFLTEVGTVDEAEEIQERHSRDNGKVALQPQLTLGGGISLDERLAISARRRQQTRASKPPGVH